MLKNLFILEFDFNLNHGIMRTNGNDINDDDGGGGGGAVHHPYNYPRHLHYHRA